MKKKILCLILVMLMLVCSLPISVFASEISQLLKDSGQPYVIVTSQYCYDEGYSSEYRALPNEDGVFHLTIGLSEDPVGDEDIIVYYRTVDDSAVAKWGDYESVYDLQDSDGSLKPEPHVILKKANGYTAQVTVRSTVIDHGFVTSGKGSGKQEDKLVTRRFLFEVTHVEGNAKKHTPSSESGSRDYGKLYCYLRAKGYNFQYPEARPDTNAWQSNMKDAYWAKMEEQLDYLWENDPAFGPIQMESFRTQVNEKWNEGTAKIPYETLYYSINSASYLNTPPIKYGGTYSDSINMRFEDEWRNYVSTGVTDLGISINGSIVRDFWDSTGDATFNLYYNYQGEKKIALTLYLEGEFDDSNFFGWEHAFEYAVEGLTDNNRDDHMDENFIGFTLYDNEGKVVYEVKTNSRSESDETKLCEDLKRTIVDNYAVELMAEYNELTKYNDNFTAYYLKLPSDFVLADSYSYELILEEEREKEIRWLENVKLSFALMSSDPPRIAKNSGGSLMISTNIETIKEDDPIIMSIRFDRPVYVCDPDNTFRITADIYSDKGVCLAKDVELNLKQIEGNKNSYYYYAWDTLVFEGTVEGLGECNIASIRNIKIDDSSGTVRSYFSNLELVGKTINDIYVSRNLRTPYAIASPQSIEDWTKPKSIDISVVTKDNLYSRFNDYVTVYYEWSRDENLEPDKITYSSNLIFYTKADGEIIRSISGKGSGVQYLYLKAVSGYGKVSYSRMGPYKFDAMPPSLSKESIDITENLTHSDIKVRLPQDDSGVRSLKLYYIDVNPETGEKKDKELRSFTYGTADFPRDASEINLTISHAEVGVGLDGAAEERKIDFYWILTDKVGNTSEPVGHFSLVFDTHNYIDSKVIVNVGAVDHSSGDDLASFESATEKADENDDKTFIFDHTCNDSEDNLNTEGSEFIYYGFAFDIDGKVHQDDVKEYYGAEIWYNGEALNSDAYSVKYREIEGKPFDTSWRVCVWFNEEVKSGLYEIRLVRALGETKQVSQTYKIYATEGKNDKTETKEKVDSGTLLDNSVYQLSKQYPYFYYKDANGEVQKEYYNKNGVKQPASFSGISKAKEYVYYRELGDIYLVQLSDSMASALNSGTAGYLIADKETITPKAGQFWIRYKSESWTPTSGDSAWVYYYYGKSALSEDSLSENLVSALNTVSNRIVSYGKTVVLTDSSLFLGTAMGDKMLDKYGMPYLLAEQIHNIDETSSQTQCGNVWSTQVAFAADRNIYVSTIYVGEVGSDSYEEFPIVGSFALPEGSRLQFMSYEDYGKQSSVWHELEFNSGEGFVDIFTSSGVYYIREMSQRGVSVFAIYVDKAAPKVTFSQTNDDGTVQEIPFDGVEITEIRVKNLHIGEIADSEYDRMSYVAIYKVSDLSLVSIYTADDLANAYVRLDDGNYYIVVSDRSGNHYTLTAKISSSDLECQFNKTDNRFMRLTCNRRSDQILRYEVYLDGELLTSTYVSDQTFDKVGYYKVYIQDIYGNVFTDDEHFDRKPPEVEWRYLSADGKYVLYDSEAENIGGFMLNRISDNNYEVSVAVKARFSIGGAYGYEFIGAKPEHKTSTVGAETVVTIEEGQSFTLKVYYRNYPECYTIYSCVVDVTPPSINVSAEVDLVENGEYSLFEEWLSGNVGDTITMNELYYKLSASARRTVANGGSINSSTIKINVNDAHELFLVEVYLNGELKIRQARQDGNGDFSEIVVNDAGDYRIIAKDTLGNVSEFTFKNGISEGLSYFVDGAEKEIELHGYLNFNEDNVYTKVDYGNKDFILNIKQESDVFLSVGVSDGNTEIYGFRISDGCIYPLTYRIISDKDNNKAIDLSVGDAILDINAKDFKTNHEYLISKDGAHEVYASVDADKVVTIKVYASDDTSKVVSVSARIEFYGSNTLFVSAEISKRGSAVSFKDLNDESISASGSYTEIRASQGFVIDPELFEKERVSSLSLYYSRRNDLDVNNLEGIADIYALGGRYSDEGFYLLVVRNHYGNEAVYRIAISRSFGITSSVTFGDGHKIYYSKDYNGKLYSNNEIIIDILDKDVTYEVTRNGIPYTVMEQSSNDGIAYLVFSQEGSYFVKLTDSYGNVIERELEINKSTYSLADDLLTGYNEKALKRNEGYTNQKLSVNKAVYDREGLYYLAIRYGDTLTVLFDAFSEKSVATDQQALTDIIGNMGDGVYTVICRNRYGSVVTKDIYYRSTPTLRLERITSSMVDPESYDLNYALSIGFWSNGSLTFSTDATTYVFTVNGVVTECPRTIVFENAGDYGSYEYKITYVDEYGFEYSFDAYLVRKSVTANIPSSITGIDVDGIFNTRNDVSITFDEGAYAVYTLNNGEEIIYHSGEVLKKDGTYRFTIIDYAGNATTTTIKKDTVVEFALVEAVKGATVQNGGVVNSARVELDILNKDSAYIEKVLLNGEVQKDFSGSYFTEDGKWELLLSDKLGNKAYFSFYIVTRAKNGFAYTTPYEYRISELWYDNGDGIKISYMSFVAYNGLNSSFNFTENGKYTVVMTSDVTGITSMFEFTVNTLAPDVSLVGCNEGETTINDVSIAGCKVGDRIKIYKETDTGEVLVEEIEISTVSTKIPTITEGGKYRVVVESEAGVATELTFVRKHVMNTAGSIFIMVIIAIAVIGLFTGLIYRNKSKTDD